MTDTITPTTTTDIVWTRQRRGLWTGRRDGSPAGTIEAGARYAFVDLDGNPHNGYRTLSDAQDAATAPIGTVRPGSRAVGRGFATTFVVVGAILVLIGAAAVGAALLLA